MVDEKLKINPGFTLIEILVAMTIATIVGTFVVSSFIDQQNANRGQQQALDMQQNLRAALHIMGKEIRMAGYDPNPSSTAGITSAGDGSSGNPLGFTYFPGDDSDGEDNDNDGIIDEIGENPELDGQDNDNDGTIDEAGELLQLIEYELYDAYGDGDNDLGRKFGSQPIQAIAENIANLSFEYLDANGAVTAVVQDIRSIKITIEATVDINEKNYIGNNRSFIATIKCRNLGI